MILPHGQVGFRFFPFCCLSKKKIFVVVVKDNGSPFDTFGLNFAFFFRAMEIFLRLSAPPKTEAHDENNLKLAHQSTFPKTLFSCLKIKVLDVNALRVR